MRRLFKKWAGYFVTSYAKKLFKQAMDAADEKARRTGKPVYVISDPFDDRKLIVLTVEEFIKMREKNHVTYLKMKSSDMIRDCWYRTENKFPVKDLYIRRLAFTRMLLHRAKLA